MGWSQAYWVHGAGLQVTNGVEGAQAPRRNKFKGTPEVNSTYLSSARAEPQNLHFCWRLCWGDLGQAPRVSVKHTYPLALVPLPRLPLKMTGAREARDNMGLPEKSGPASIR